MSKWKQTHLPCPECDSSDGYSIDQGDNGYCFVCTTFVPADGGSSAPAVITREQADLILGGEHLPVPARKISQQTCEFFDVKISNDQVVFPYYDTSGSLVAQKCRPLKEKVFFWKGAVKDGTLFGQNKFASGHAITIVEGEFDALAFRDLVGDYPVVSVINGAQGGVKDVRKNIDFFKNFQKIYLCLDNDEEGKKASQKIAELFPIGKVKIVNLRHHKDAGDYLKAGDHEAFKRCWHQAVDYTPAGIEAANEGGFESLFDEVDGLELYPYPYDKLNEATFGIRKGEMVTVVAGSGVGKSAFISEVAYNLMMSTRSKVGMLMLEESPKKTKLKMMSLFLNKPLHLTLLGRVAEKFDFLEKVLDRIFKNGQDWKWNDSVKKELKHAWNEVIERKTPEGDNQLWLFSHFGSNDIDTIVNRIDAMVTGLGCEFIFLDHISIVVSDQQNADERKALDELATKLRTLVERRNFSLVIVSHLRRPGGKPHEEGGETSLSDIRGTAGIGQLSDIVIGLERNGQHENEYLRNITKMRVLKNRFAGFTGLTSYGAYDIETGRLLEADPKEVEAMFNDSESSFQPIDDDTPVFDETDSGTKIHEREVA
jgi:twinkle protein